MSEKPQFKNETKPLRQEILQDNHNIKPTIHRLEQEKAQQDIKEIRKNVEQQAQLKEVYKQPPEAEHGPTHHYLTKKIKETQYKLTLKQIQKQLPKTQKVFSNFIHQSAIETISEIGSKTIARPKGILGGGIVALLGSVTILFISHKIGFAIPNSLFVALFIVGFASGCLLEMLTKLIKRVF